MLKLFGFLPFVCLVWAQTQRPPIGTYYSDARTPELWTQVGPSDSDYEQLLEDSSRAELDQYIFPNLTCQRGDKLAAEMLLRLLPSRIRYRWPTLLNKNSFRTSSTWQDNARRGRTYPHRQILASRLNSTNIFYIFLPLVVLLLIVVILVLVPCAGFVFRLCYLIYALLTHRSIRLCLRSWIISFQKLRRRLEIARTPERFRLDAPYNLPKFFRKDADDEYPEELEEYDLYLKRLHGRLQSEIKISDRFGNYMQQRGLEYDPLLHRFRYRFEKPPEDAVEAAELKKRLKAQRVQQARELLVQESDYMTNIPDYRRKALELGIPYAEDEERSIILTTLKQIIPKKKSKPSALDVVSKVIKKPSKKKSSKSNKSKDDVEAGPDSEPGPST